MGDDLEEDFWVGPDPRQRSYELQYEEVICQDECLKRLPDCFGYSVKVKHPMKGQCYLKREPAVGKNGEFEKVYNATSYNSARITSQAFSHCKSNVYAEQSVFDPNADPKNTGCWENVPGTASDCRIANMDCINIQCTNTQMIGFIRATAFHDDSLLDQVGL